MSIKLPEFSLTHVYALEGHEEMENSANKPVLVSAVNEITGIRADYVVKLNASERMHEEARMRELIAAFMAIELEIPVVVPAIINVSQDFCNTLIGKSYFQKATKSLGYNVGSEYLADHFILDNFISLNDAQEKNAQQIFSFDLMIENVDRNYSKPNMITNGNELRVLDHELAFGFIMTLPFLRNPTPWLFNDGDLKWIKEHCLFKRLKGKVGELESFKGKLVRLDAEFWDKVQTLIPEEWFKEELFIGIKTHIDAMVVNRHEFITSIKRLLV